MDDMPLFSPFKITGRNGVRHFSRPAIMGILNITDDSFYDGGRYTTSTAILAHARQLLADGADIIDIGAVSSRPGAALLPPHEEAARLAPVVKMLRNELPPSTLLSVDTCFSQPALAAYEAGVDIVNDISGGQLDPQMIPFVDARHIPYILMHMRGTPTTMQQPSNTTYGDIVDDLAQYFRDRLALFSHPDQCDIFLDPGFGFAKTVELNHQLLHRLPELIGRFPDYPFLIALSNKSMITRKLPSYPAACTFSDVPDSEWGTLVLNTLALQAGAAILRVHTPRPTRIAIHLLYELVNSDQ